MYASYILQFYSCLKLKPLVYYTTFFLNKGDLHQFTGCKVNAKTWKLYYCAVYKTKALTQNPTKRLQDSFQWWGWREALNCLKGILVLNGKITHTLTSSYKPIFKVFYIKQTKIHSPRNEAYDFVVQAFIAKRERELHPLVHSFYPCTVLYFLCCVCFQPFFFLCWLGT